MEKKAKKPIWKKWWVWVLAVIIVGAIGSAGDGDDSSKSVAVQEESVANTENSSKDTSNVVETNEEKKDIKIKAGTYKIGTDLPAGEYLFFAKGIGYIEVTSDSTGSLDSIITNDNVKGHKYITVNDGEYLKIRSGEFYAVADAPSVVPEDGIYKDGTYIVGKDIPAGEYKVTLTSSIGMGYIEVSSDSRGTFDSIITNDNLMEDSYITVEDGQYLKLSGAEININ
ncbi:hypothetical protein [Clostridium sp. D53t1_180928_C8]|uniref:hypothetical protein n=1 Tax=Clostridium sp. D53t1_180928_C8 TaxID=2787101 RepID=UPI0018ABC60D|nr:hypothetical protein [Clostridium sp. D53t1_180928_C8]